MNNYRLRSAAAAALLLAAVSVPVGAAPPTVARGIVFVDANANGTRDADEHGVPDVVVSNQREVVVTDADGAYSLPLEGDAVIFVTKPAGFSLPVDDHNLPRFYYIYRPEGSPQSYYPGLLPTGPLPASIDFPLLPAPDEPEAFRVVTLSDPQPETSQEVEFIREDVLEELIETPAAFAVVLGDIMFDRLELFEPYNDYMSLLGYPIHSVTGNHDMNYDADDDRRSNETFVRLFGPTYYSWDFGRVHFVALDNILWKGRTQAPEWPDTQNYDEGLDETQLAWLRADIAHVAPDRLVVLLSHAPIARQNGKRILGCDELFDLLRDRQHLLALNGHLHLHSHMFFGEEQGWKGAAEFHQLNCTTICGSWWSGPKDYRGVPISDLRDGSPNGYVLVDFDGVDYTTSFRAAGASHDFQMRIYLPGEQFEEDSDEKTPKRLLANIFDGSDRSVVEFRIDRGEWEPMALKPQFDPLAAALFSGPIDTGKGWVGPVTSYHIWEVEMPKQDKGPHLVEVRHTDMYGRTFTSGRMWR